MWRSRSRSFSPPADSAKAIDAGARRGRRAFGYLASPYVNRYRNAALKVGSSFIPAPAVAWTIPPLPAAGTDGSGIRSGLRETVEAGARRLSRGHYGPLVPIRFCLVTTNQGPIIGNGRSEIICALILLPHGNSTRVAQHGASRQMEVDDRNR
jgi:hypothetical protein